MPHMNRIRLVDVAFNDAKSFYDDFMMVLNGKSATFDLENGGGKSVLLMMMLQVVLPNASLREDKPLRNIFLGGKDRTSHVLVEWKLDEGSPYKYMLTGFCARKSRSNIKEDNNTADVGDSDIEIAGGGIEYFNYFHLYNNSNEHDIKELQLCSKQNDRRITMSYEQLKDLIRQLNKKGKAIDLFERRGEYIQFLKQYNLIDTEWKIIKEINSGENSIEKYFRQNKTSRKLIENLLVKIIEDTEAQGVSKALGDSTNDNNLADTLIEIRENINRFLKDKQHLHEYTQILEFYNKIKNIDEHLKQDFNIMEELRVKVVMSLNKIVNLLDELKAERAVLEDKRDKTAENLNAVEIEKECLDIQFLDFQKACFVLELNEVERKSTALEEQKNKYFEEYNLCNAQSEYLKYKTELHKLNIAKSKMESMEKGADEIYKEYKTLGFNYRVALQKIIEKHQHDRCIYIEKKKEFESKKKDIRSQVDDIIEQLGSIKKNIQDLDKQKKNCNDELQTVTQVFQQEGRIDIIMSPQEWHEKLKNEIDETTSRKLELEDKKSGLNQAVLQAGNKLTEIQGDINVIDEKLKTPQSFIKEYSEEKLCVDKLCELYDIKGTHEDLEIKLSHLLAGLKNSEIAIKVEHKSICKKIDIFNQYDYYVPNEEVLVLREKLRKKYQNVFLGIDLLHNEDEEGKKKLIEINSLIPYSIVMDHTGFNKFKDNVISMEEGLADYPIPIIDIDFIREKQSLSSKHMLFWSGEKDIFINEDALRNFKDSLINKSESLGKELNSINERINEVNNDKGVLTAFRTKFREEYVTQAINEIENLNQSRKTLSEQMIQLKNITGENNNKINKLEDDIQKTQQRSTQLTHTIDQLLSLIKLNKDMAEIEQNLQQAVKDKKLKEEQRALLHDEIDRLEGELHLIDENTKNIDINASQYQKDLDKVSTFEDGVSLDMSYDKLKSEFEAMYEMVQSQDRESERIREEIESCKKYMKDNENRIVQYGYNVDYFIEKEVQGQILTEFSIDYITMLRDKQEELSAQIKDISKVAEELKSKIDTLKGSVNTKTKTLTEEKGKSYIPVEGLSSEQQIKDAIEDAKTMIHLFKGDQKKYDMQFKDMTEKIDGLSMEQRDIMSFINTQQIEMKSSGVLENAITFENIIAMHTAIQDNLNNRRKLWDKTVRIITAQAQAFYISDPIKQLEDLEAPASLKEAETAVKQFDESIYIIHEKMQKLQEDINVLEGYQEEFIRQCIQRSEWILEKLKKFPSLSRIELYGTSRNMIEAKFSDYSEQDKNQRMKNHIHNIIKEIDNEKEIDKSKIAGRLSSKELLAQITDMDKVSIKLYKVESIEEHSGYKRWDHAVGSEGQSNALYFIFAVCLIAYIRMLSLENTCMKSQKVIIADNPFGATSAVYLWEPMFNILKENEVQLIAPGHRISKELTSKFEVNYLLNQEVLSDNRIKVVVKDVRTEEDLEQMNFNALEQITLL